MPRLDIAGFTIDDSIGNASGGADPLEPVRLSVSLKNGWRGAAFGVAGATATLSSSTPGVSIPDNTAAYPAIAGGATVAPSDTFVFVPPSSACGSAIDFTLQVTSTLGVSTQNFSIRLGLPSGTGTPIEYVFPVGPALVDPGQRADRRHDHRCRSPRPTRSPISICASTISRTRSRATSRSCCAGRTATAPTSSGCRASSLARAPATTWSTR